MPMRKQTLIPIFTLNVLIAFSPANTAAQSPSPDSWKPTEMAAAKASKSAHFAEAEKLLNDNLNLAETLTAKDARRPRTMYDLAQVYRAEGKYDDAFPLYERALQLYITLYGHDAEEIADT